MQQDNFEQRLGEGLRRWAASGQPTLDLEAYVKANSRKPNRFVRWATAAAAAAALVVGMSATFPKWAGAASGLPLVGPIITRMIMDDVGLKWAYEAGLIKGTLAEVKHGDLTFKLLGVSATELRTDLFYQITGWPDSVRPDERIGTTPDGLPIFAYPEIRVRKIPGTLSIMQGSSPPEKTPVGLVGRVLTSPLGEESGVLELDIIWGEEVTPIKVEVSRKEASKYFRTVPVNRSQTIDGITVTVDSVVFAPEETWVRYHSEAEPRFTGSFVGRERDDRDYIEVDGKPVYGHQHLSGSPESAAFAVTSGKGRFVVPMEVKGAPADLTWPLEPGATQSALGANMQLTEVRRSDGKIHLSWKMNANGGPLMGISELEVVDASGAAVPIRMEQGSMSSRDPQGRWTWGLSCTIPEEFQPVAVRARQIGVAVEGPWVIELPTR